MQVNKLNRIKQYSIAIELIDAARKRGDYRVGICGLLNFVVALINTKEKFNSKWNKNKELYPEIFTTRNKIRCYISLKWFSDPYWFNVSSKGALKRIALLNKAIAEAKKAKY